MKKEDLRIDKQTPHCKNKIEKAFYEFRNKKYKLCWRKIYRNNKPYNMRKKSWFIRVGEKLSNHQEEENAQKVKKDKNLDMEISRILIRQFVKNKEKYRNDISNISVPIYVPKELIKIILRQEVEKAKKQKNEGQSNQIQKKDSVQKICSVQKSLEIQKQLLLKFEQIKDISSISSKSSKETEEQKIKHELLRYFTHLEKKIETNLENKKQKSQMQVQNGDQDDSAIKEEQLQYSNKIESIPEYTLRITCSTIVIKLLFDNYLSKLKVEEKQSILKGKLLENFIEFMFSKLFQLQTQTTKKGLDHFLQYFEQKAKDIFQSEVRTILNQKQAQPLGKFQSFTQIETLEQYFENYLKEGKPNKIETRKDKQETRDDELNDSLLMPQSRANSEEMHQQYYHWMNNHYKNFSQRKKQ